MSSDVYIDSLTTEGDSTIGNTTIMAASTNTSTTTLSLTTDSVSSQYITGSTAGFSVVLPDATTLTVGQLYEVYNASSVKITIKDYGTTTLITLLPKCYLKIGLQTNSTTAGVWQTLVSPMEGSYNITSSYLEATASFATTSSTDVVITGFTLTPVVGTYLVVANMNASNSLTGSSSYATIYNAGSAITTSIRAEKVASSNESFTFLSLAGGVVCDGSGAVDIRVRRSGGTLTITNRALMLVRMGV